MTFEDRSTQAKEGILKYIYCVLEAYEEAQSMSLSAGWKLEYKLKTEGKPIRLIQL